MKSIKVTLGLLKTLVDDQEEVSVHDISRKIGFSKSTTHRALQALEEEGFAVKNPESKHYKYGPQLLDLAFNFIIHFNLRNIAQVFLRRLADEVNENIYLCVYSDHSLYFIDMFESTHPIRYVNPMGRRRYLHAGAAGKVVLAYLPMVEREKFLQAGLPRFTPNTITKPESLRYDLDRIMKQGYAFSEGEFSPGGVAIAVPILDLEAYPVGCVNIVIPENRFEMQGKERLIKLLQKAAKTIQDRFNEAGGGILS